jgi:hypothetical protein
MRFLRLGAIGALSWMSSCNAREPAGAPGDASTDELSDAPGDASADPNASEDASRDTPKDVGVAAEEASDVPDLDDRTIDAGICPTPFSQGVDLCRFCPGLACQAGDECDSMYHSGGPAATHCSCVNGRMQCCYQILITGLTYYRCDYGTLPRPACPADNPRFGDACGPDLQLCGLPTCCSGWVPGAYCDGTHWVPGGSDVCNRPPGSCTPGQPALACTVQETVLMCTCDGEADAGATMWQCDGPG